MCISGPLGSFLVTGRGRGRPICVAESLFVTAGSFAMVRTQMPPMWCTLVTMLPRFRERTSGKEKKKVGKPAHSEEEGGEKSTHRETASLRILVYRD